MLLHRTWLIVVVSKTVTPKSQLIPRPAVWPKVVGSTVQTQPQRAGTRLGRHVGVARAHGVCPQVLPTDHLAV